MRLSVNGHLCFLNIEICTYLLICEEHTVFRIQSSKEIRITNYYYKTIFLHPVHTFTTVEEH